MNVIVIHALWWLFGFACGFVVMGALALSSELSRMEESPVVLDSGDWEPIAPQTATIAELAEAQATARYYQDLFEVEQRKSPPPAVVIRDDPQTLEALTQAQTTARFYQELYLDEMDRMKLK